MESEKEKLNPTDDVRTLRKKIKRIEESRSSIKDKSREKGKIIKMYQDRENELKENRDKWKIKCREQEKECAELDKKYKHVAELFEMKEEQLKDILREFEELKKKYPPKRRS